MKLSVLLPVYNAGTLLQRAIVSILQQEFTDFEFIIIDDASKDGSDRIVMDFASRDPRIKAVCHGQNAGLSATLNEGLALASTPLVARMDQDDESLPSRLGTQYVFMKSRPEVAAAGSFAYHMGMTPADDRLIRLPVEPAEIAQRLQTENCLYHPTVIMNREMALNAGGYRAQFKNAEDYDLWLRLSRIHKLENIPVPLLRYNLTVDGMSLGRKWEQLYYVYLAQAAFRHPAEPWPEIEHIAKEAHTRQDKGAFLIAVLEGTVTDLMNLRRIEEAEQLTQRFGGELGSEKAARIFHGAVTAHREPRKLGKNDWLEEFIAFRATENNMMSGSASKSSHEATLAGNHD